MRHRYTLLVCVGVVALATLGLKLWLNKQRLPQSTYRMGYENNPPNMTVGAGGEPGGLAIEVVLEAARRANIRLQWIRYEGRGSPLQEGIVDMWPLMADLPGRQNLHFTDPWLQTRYMFLYRTGQESPMPDYRGRIGHYSQPLHGRLLHEHYPQATDKSYPSREALVHGLCQGEVDAAFLEERAVSRWLSDTEGPAPPCSVQAAPIADVFVQFSLSSTKNAAAAADRIREQIGEMARDGTLVVYLSRYANSGVHDATAAFELAQARQRARWLEILASCLVVALALMIGQNGRIRAARRLVEQSSELLRTSEAHFRTLLEHAADLILVIDGAGLLTYISPSCPNVLGWQSGDWMHKNLQDLLHSDDRPSFQAAIADVTSPAGLPLRIRIRGLHRQKNYRTFEAFVRRLPESGDPASLLINGHDVTEEACLQEQLQQAQKMEAIGRLAGGIAHDFNNLLTVINGYSRMLIRRAAPSDPSAEKLTQILRAGERAATLTQQLLTFSRKQVNAPRNLDLNATIGEALEMLQVIMGESISITTVLDPSLGTVFVDPDQMHQVLMNLAANARDAIPHSGKLLVETQNVEFEPGSGGDHAEGVPGRYVLMSVTDSGAGMEAGTLQSIFEPFFTTKEKGKGTGLGLAAVHGIVRQSGGWIRVSSEPGKGTTFKIYLPRIDARPNAVRPEVTAASAGPIEGRTILVVEDQVEVRKYVADVLRLSGYRVIQAENAFEAMQLCDRDGEHIDLVLTDVVMPNLSGKELADWLSKHWPNVKVLFMSGYADAAVMHHGILQNVARLIQKPFSSDQLAIMVREILTAPDHGVERESV
jgi:PAS domain S-box-containing protein